MVSGTAIAFLNLHGLLEVCLAGIMAVGVCVRLHRKAASEAAPLQNPFQDRCEIPRWDRYTPHKTTYST